MLLVSRAPREPFTDEETLFAELIAQSLEQELRYDRALDRIGRLDQFASIVSHDLRNPLTVAKGRVAAAADETANEHLDHAGNALDRMEQLIADVLAMAKQSQDAQEAELIHLLRVVETCWDAVKTQEAKLVVENDLQFAADPGRIEHLFENLFRNGVEHGGEDILISVGALPDGDGFFVEDDGPGIPEEHRRDVFETGFSTGGEGIGIGLAIVAGVVSAHNWEIEITEGERGGARFEVTRVVVSLE